MDRPLIIIAVDIAYGAAHHEFARHDLHELHADCWLPGILREQGTCQKRQCCNKQAFHELVLQFGDEYRQRTHGNGLALNNHLHTGRHKEAADNTDDTCA